MKPQKSRTGERGFTLLELLVAITVAAILLALVAPGLSGTVSHARLKTSAAKIAAVLRETRWEAMSSSEPAIFAVDPSARGFSVNGKDTALPSGQTIVFDPYNRDGLEREPKITFLPDGGSSGGTIAVLAGNDRVQVEVDWLTGRVTTRE